MSQIAEGVLQSQVFRRLAEIGPRCRPHLLGEFWTLCRVLLGMAGQLDRSREVDVYVVDIIQEFSSSVRVSAQAHNVGFRDLLDTLSTVPGPELLDTIRIGCLCTTRALSKNLRPEHPIVLEAWANYHRYWDANSLDKQQFLTAYATGLRDVERVYGLEHDYTISVLTDYSNSAHNLCRDVELAKALAAPLWE